MCTCRYMFVMLISSTDASIACPCVLVPTHMYMFVTWCIDGLSDLFKGMFVHMHVPVRTRVPEKGPQRLSGD